MTQPAGMGFSPNIQSPRLSGIPVPTFTVATDATSALITYTVAQLIGGFLIRTPGASRSDVMPTAALLLAAIPSPEVGVGFDFTIKNGAGSAYTITVTAGTGVTTSGTMTIAQNYTKRFRVVFTNVTAGSEAYTVYSLGTALH